jgi:PAS domain-containing protein
MYLTSTTNFSDYVR